MTAGVHQAHPAGRPVTRWVLLVGLLTGLLVALTLSDLLSAGGAVHEPGSSVLVDVGEVGPVVDLSGETIRSAGGDPDQVGIALVDTGDPEAFAPAASRLAAEGVAATWFVEGGTALDHPGAVRSAAGPTGELGTVGFSGRQLPTLAPWRVRLELSTSQAALASRFDRTSTLLMLPSAATPDRLDHDAFQTARAAAARGHLLVLGVDPEEAVGGQVAVVPLDDRAPGRLDALLTRLRDQGLDPVPVSDLAGLTAVDVNRPVDGWVGTNATLVMLAVRASRFASGVVGLLFLPMAVLLAARALVGVAVAVVHARRRRPIERWEGPVTVVVPAYDEAAGIEASLRSLVASTWPWDLEIIVVDDGSTDGTGEIAEQLGLPEVRVLRQANQGKPAALNAGIAEASYDVVVLVDGDTVFEPDTIAELVAPFADPEVGATSGNAKVIDRRTLLGRWQHIEYVMGFNLDRRLLATFDAMPTVPGAVGAFRRAALADAGGLSHDTLAEDTDVTIAMARSGWRVVYQPEAVAWTEAPSSVGDLWRQRYRWCYGTLQAAWKHRRALVERRPIGLVGLPYALAFQVVVAAIAPVVDVAAVHGALTGDARTVALAWTGFTLAQVVLGVVAFRLDHEPLGPLWAAPLQQVVYRQLMYLVVIQSLVAAGAGTRLRWHKLRRSGLAGAPVVVPSAAVPPAPNRTPAPNPTPPGPAQPSYERGWPARR